MRYIEGGHLPIDNNRAENAIRPFVNWLFSDMPKGASASAKIYSLIETTKSNSQKPNTWLRQALERLPVASCAGEYEALLPQNCPPKPHPDHKTSSKGDGVYGALTTAANQINRRKFYPSAAHRAHLTI